MHQYPVRFGPAPRRARVGLLVLGLLGLVISGCGGGSSNNDEVTPPASGTLQFSTSAYSGNEDGGAITVTVTRTGGSAGIVTVDLSDTGTGSASAGVDYNVITPTTLTWADGDIAAKTFNVTPVTDGAVESDETVELTLGNATGGATLGTAAAVVSIVNDDVAAAPGTLQFSPAAYTAAEAGGPATITVIRVGGDTGAVSVEITDSGTGTATSGSDYNSVGVVTLSWADGESGARTYDVTVINDTAVEGDETLILSLGNETGGATLGNSSATLTITSEDAYGALQFSSASYAIDETAGVVTDIITLQRVGGSSGAVQVDVSDAGTGTAAPGAGADYVFTSPTTVSWADGDTGDKTVTITMVDDATYDGPLTVDLTLGAYVGGATAGAATASTITINDDEVPAPGVLGFSSPTYTVAESGVSAVITVSRAGGSDGAVQVSYATSDNTATAGSDYTAVSNVLSWADGDATDKTFAVPIINDTVVESVESIDLTLSAPTGGATLGAQSTATLSIDIDETNLTMTIGDGTYWVAFQDGPAGQWQQWAPIVDNVYNFPVTDTSLRYGVAFHRTESGGGLTAEKVYVIQATVTELPSFYNFNNAKYTVSGTLSNFVVNGDEAGAFMYIEGDSTTTAPYPYSLPNIPAGLRDFVAYEGVPAGGGLPNNVVFLRDVDISGDTVIDVDFSDPASTTPLTSLDRTFISGTGFVRWLDVFYATANGTSIPLVGEVYDGTTAVHYPYLTNVEATDAGDGYSFQAYNTTWTKYRVRNKTAASDPGNMDVGLGSLADMTGSVVTASGTTGLAYTPDPTSFSGSPVFRAFQVSLDQTNYGINGGAHWEIKITKGWLDATSATSYTHPVFSGVSGFATAWDMQTGTTTHATVTAVTSTNGVGAGVEWIFRKTMGNSSRNTDPDGLVYPMKLAHKNTVKVDFASEYSTFTW